MRWQGIDAVRAAQRAPVRGVRCACSASRPCSGARRCPTACRPASPRTSRAATRRCRPLRRCETMRRCDCAAGVVATAMRYFGCGLAGFGFFASAAFFACSPWLRPRPSWRRRASWPDRPWLRALSPWPCGDRRCACAPHPRPSWLRRPYGPASRPSWPLLAFLASAAMLRPISPGGVFGLLRVGGS